MDHWLPTAPDPSPDPTTNFYDPKNPLENEKINGFIIHPSRTTRTPDLPLFECSELARSSDGCQQLRTPYLQTASPSREVFRGSLPFSCDADLAGQFRMTEFCVGRAAAFLTTRDIFFGALLVSKEARKEVLAHVEDVSITHAPQPAIAMLCPSLKRAPQAAITILLAQSLQLTTLNLSGCDGLTTLPEEIGKCAALETLNLSFCRSIRTLPERLGDCVALKTLTLSVCDGLIALPEGLGDCTALMTLVLASCRSLTALPERIGDCVALMTLNLFYCASLSALPERLGDCAALTTLNLTLCLGLASLPERLDNCAVLTTLDLTNCNNIPSHLDVAEKLKARGCTVRR